jgi:hypothetical protein
MGHGLTVRWSLLSAPDGVEQALSDYVEQTSHARYTGKAGLRFKTWRTVPGEWFEGCYVFDSERSRDEFLAGFAPEAATSRASQIVGSAPVLMEPCEVVAVAEGGAGFLAAPAYP